MANEIRVTHAGAYVEVDPADSARVSHVGAYAEIDPADSARVSHVGAYVEVLAPRLIIGYAVRDGFYHVALTSLDPQPRSEGVKVTRRTHSANHKILDEGLYVELLYSALGSVAEYQSVLTQLGLLDALTNQITLHARDARFAWRRYNGLAVRPQMAQDLQWSSYFPRNIVVLVKDLERLA